ncbi:MAG: thiamine phosphate synthase [Planctomycetota bacterium]|nr:thiamine phosphate synthase [Planctomycetota bacterium]
MLHRLLDANRNRAMEALRVLEDIARFGPAADALAGECKSLRHRMTGVLSSLDAGRFIAARDVAGDAGCSRSGACEAKRAGIAELAEANGARLCESLRTLEEALKLSDPAAAQAMERIRYDAYAVVQSIVTSLGSGRARQWSLCLLLTRDSCRRPWREVLEASLRAGCDAVQVREKSMEGADLVAHARAVAQLARAYGAAVIVNDRVDVAMAAGADGVHLGQTDMSITDARRLAGRTLLIGLTTHSVEEARAASIAGADMIGIGPMFPSGTKPNLAAAGPSLLRDVLAGLGAAATLPHLAIGGIGPDEARLVAAAGARGVAVSAAICGADSPGDATARILEAIHPRGIASEAIGSSR